MLTRVQAAIDDIRAGKMVILVDDEERENEGDLTLAAECVTAEAINFMAKYGRGLICLTLTGAQVDRLELPMMQVPGRRGPALGTAFTVSIEGARGCHHRDQRGGPRAHDPGRQQPDARPRTS
jgi:3,4-dihydroxy 2-butanone 4-phosphate synthase/GTP cyclohydrolase II